MGVLEFLLDERAAGCPVSNDDLKDKAREIAHGIVLEEFIGSDGWQNGCKKKNHVAIRRGTNKGQKLSEEFRGQEDDFKDAVHNKRRELYPGQYW